MKKRIFRKLHKDLFYAPKHEMLTAKVFWCRLILSLFTILACTAIMVASTFALFYKNVSTDNSTIASAYYSVNVDKAENGIYICPLAYEDKHTFKITPAGTATTGYCKIQVGEQVYYTEQIPRGSSLNITVQAAKGTMIAFTPQWGTPSSHLNIQRCANEIIHSTTPYAVYEVEPTARLGGIAAHYGVSEADILLYNNISANSKSVSLSNGVLKLEVGTKLKIPGVAKNAVPYTVPYAVYTVEPTAKLEAISAHYSVSIEDIFAFNDMSEFDIGMTLKIPNADRTMPSYAVPYAIYIIEENATLEGISEYYGVSLADIVIYNHFAEPVVGYKLKIPGVSPDTTPYVAPLPQLPEEDPKLEGPALLHREDDDYTLISESTILLKDADIIIYKGHEYESIEEYQKDLDLRITGIEAITDMQNKTGEYFCNLQTKAERLSLCFEITENIENGYLKIIIGEDEYYTVQIKQDSYIRLELIVPIGSKISFEAYEGRPTADTLYGDDINDMNDAGRPLLVKE